MPSLTQVYEALYEEIKKKGISSCNKRLRIDNSCHTEETADCLPALPLLRNFSSILQQPSDNVTQLKVLYSKFSYQTRDVFDFLQTTNLQIMYRERSRQNSMNERCSVLQHIFAALYCFYHRNSLVVRFCAEEPPFLDYQQVNALEEIQKCRKEALNSPQLITNSDTVQNIESMLRSTITKLNIDKEQLEEEVKFLTFRISQQKQQIVHLQSQIDVKKEEDRRVVKFIATTQRGFEKSNKKQLRLLAKLENKARSASSMLTVLQAKLSEVDSEQKDLEAVAVKMRSKKRLLDIVTKSATKANLMNETSESDTDSEEENVPQYAIISSDAEQEAAEVAEVEEIRVSASSSPVVQEEDIEVELISEADMNEV